MSTDLIKAISMKLLYLSCHSILEYDEIRLFSELGIEVFSLGSYLTPSSPREIGMRPALEGVSCNLEDLSAYHKMLAHVGDARSNLTENFVNRFDAVMIMHMPEWVACNWKAMRNRPVVWRTIGQSKPSVETMMARYRADGLKIVRYSPAERNIPHYCGGDVQIRFYKDPNEFGNWNGCEQRVITFCQSMPVRRGDCNYRLFQKVTSPFPRTLFGPGNQRVGKCAAGRVSYDSLKEELRNNRVFFSTGSHPASYTLNFMEAWITGIPVVAIGSIHGNKPSMRRHNLYEVPSMIKDGVNGFCSDDPSRLRANIDALLNDKELALQISSAGRRSAIKYFGKDSIKPQWARFFKNLCDFHPSYAH